ncbi:MAG TPA: efflux RND transporter periplasmic adaptor subunit [Thermoanaerobaculales bacterium]|nr:efflux RND transporter periplasmic adaptor subunit [Thermoanaerobaculales bacterium]HPA82030.1 efflux RND transporter periplasmic adaptor subunit [Thermoanaerobaculales bacterium]HQL29455.1 efflux RND transporter periplasmic adaptor subunit [Thermoanaerobaculales bacterium]HQN95100.1 efflux RND transporter periplasmic adaptor subunit [Thermoanaerobaculales bacterium]HQP43420.1 efflux RND transporter periplasmic adaptor subunit [Thermoanaerobaculales bacterium]
MSARHRTPLTIIAASLLASIMAACHPGGGETPEAAAAVREAALAPREVRLITPEVREERRSIQLVGEIRAFDSVEVSPEVAGKVEAVRAEVGDRVRSGQPLAEIDRTTYKIYLDQAEAQLLAASADLELAAKELERKRDLLSDNTIAPATFDQAKAAHDLAKAQVQSAEAARSLAQRNWERSVLRAPASGAITSRSVVAGQWTDVGQPLFELAVGEKVKVAAKVPAAWAPQLGGLEGFDFTVAAPAGARHATLYSVDPAVDESSRSFEVVGVADNPAGALRPGMFADVTLQAPESARSLWLPVTAVATSDMSQVMVVEDGAIALRRVQVGRRVDDSLEILAGIEDGQPVVADVAGLNRGAPVRVVGGPADANS